MRDWVLCERPNTNRYVGVRFFAVRSGYCTADYLF
jgi:hypothetical protein